MAERRRSSVVEVKRANDGVLRVNDNAMRRMSLARENIATEVHDARGHTEREHAMSVRDSVKLYKKAIIFSLILSTAVVMEGKPAGYSPSKVSANVLMLQAMISA